MENEQRFRPMKWIARRRQKKAEKARDLYEMGKAFLNGKGVPKNPAKAFRYTKQAADLGSAMAQNAVGWMLQAGRGTNRNDLESVDYFRRAARQGLKLGKENLEEMLRQGRGVPPKSTGSLLRKAGVAAGISVCILSGVGLFSSFPPSRPGTHRQDEPVAASRETLPAAGGFPLPDWVRRLAERGSFENEDERALPRNP